MFFNESVANPNGFFGRDVSGQNNPNFGKGDKIRGYHTYKDKEGNKFRLLNTDQRVTSGELVPYGRGRKLSEEDKKNKSKASEGKRKTEEHVRKVADANRGKHTYIDKNGNKIHCELNDPRVLRGELIDPQVGKKYNFCCCAICKKEIPVNNLSQHIIYSHDKRPRNYVHKPVLVSRLTDRKVMDIGNFTLWMQRNPV